MSPGLKHQATLLAECSESRPLGKEDGVKRLGKDVKPRRQKEGTPRFSPFAAVGFADIAHGKETELCPCWTNIRGPGLLAS